MVRSFLLTLTLVVPGLAAQAKRTENARETGLKISE
jgi:hypothetical protein